MSKRDEHVSAMLVQKHQLDQSESKVSELDSALEALLQSQKSNNDALDQALADLDGMLETRAIDPNDAEMLDVSWELEELVQSIDVTCVQSRYVPSLYSGHAQFQ